MEMAAARDRLVDSLVATEVITKTATAEALRAVPRHEFVGDDQQELAYQDRPLPIGNDQTISAPHIVGQMLDLINVGPGDRVLEIGTGCGYHAAVTAEVVGDGRDGWPEKAPFDASYLTCAAAEPPAAVIKQTATDAVVVGPFGAGQQELKRLTPQPDGGYEAETIAPVRFVTMQ